MTERSADRSPLPPGPEPLPRELRAALWNRITARLRQGEVLITQVHFRQALEQEYGALTGQEPGAEIRLLIRQMVDAVNTRYPETYVVQGVQNGVNRAFDKGVRALRWDEAKVQSRGARSIQRFSRREDVREFLDEVNVRPNQIDAIRCVQQSLRQLNQVEPPPRLAPAAPPDTFVLPPPPPAVEAPPPEPAKLDQIDAGEVGRRLQEQEERRLELEKGELERVPSYLDSYVSQGVLSAEEADQVRSLGRVDELVRRGEIDAEEAHHIRNSILDADVRDRLEKKIRAKVEQSVRYLEVFEAMQKIDPDCDRALDLLIRYKEEVTAGGYSLEEGVGVLRELAINSGLLQEVVDIMERKDHEIRMLAVRLPPYNHIMKRGLEHLANMTIEPSFLEQLRQGSTEELAEQLNSPTKEKRVRPAADMRCLISLVDHVIKRTPFRKELRLLRISQSIEEFYRAAPDIKQARSQAESFLNLRLRRLFPDLSATEASEMKQRGAQIIEAIEKRILDQGREEEEQRRLAETAMRTRRLEEDDEAEEMELSDEEKSLGVMIGRVEVRVAGNYRRVPNKIMVDPEEPDKYIIVRRDPESGELVAQLRRGAKRYVERGKDGIWQVV